MLCSLAAAVALPAAGLCGEMGDPLSRPLLRMSSWKADVKFMARARPPSVAFCGPGVFVSAGEFAVELGTFFSLPETEEDRMR